MTSRRRPDVVDHHSTMARSGAPGGTGSLRLEHWPGDPTAALLVQNDHTSPLSMDELRAAVAEARRRGYRIARTSALLDTAEATIAAAGFETIDRLVLLSTTVESTAPRSTGEDRDRRADDPSMRIRRLRARHHRAASDLDRAAFGEFWGCDIAGIEAIGGATPVSRGWYVTGARRTPMRAYLVVGRGLDQRGYLQRLAVHPEWWRKGYGTVLVERARQWLTGEGVREILVNTSVDNHAALALYHRCGFTPTQHTMVVGQMILEAGRTPIRKVAP